MRIVCTFEELGQRGALREEGGRYDILLGNVVLLSSAALGTERAFGALAAELLGQPPKRVIVGGLGFGATVRGVLDVTGEDTEVIVVEKLASVRRILERPEIAPLSQGAMADPRVRVVEGDVYDFLATRPGADLILLDTDNGPEWASFRTNARLYAPEGLSRARAALTAAGALAVWSGYPRDAFLGKLRAAGFTPCIVPLREGAVVRARAYVGRIEAIVNG